MCNPEIRPLLERIQHVANAADAKPLHWIGGGPNEGLHYCRQCAEKEIARLAAANPAHEYFLDGGWVASAEDGCAHCEICSILLEYTLSHHGVESELDHYVRHMQRKGPLAPGEAYHIAAILEQAEWTEDMKLVKRAVRMGKRAVALVPHTPDREGR